MGLDLGATERVDWTAGAPWLMNLMMSNGLRLRHRPLIVRYAAAGLFVVLAALARLLLAPILSDRHPFSTFYISVTAAAWWGAGPDVVRPGPGLPGR